MNIVIRLALTGTDAQTVRPYRSRLRAPLQSLYVGGGDTIVELDGGMLDVEFVVEVCVEEALQDLCASLDEERLDALTMQEREELAHLASRGEAGDVGRILSVMHLLEECRREEDDRWCGGVL